MNASLTSILIGAAQIVVGAALDALGVSSSAQASSSRGSIVVVACARERAPRAVRALKSKSAPTKSAPTPLDGAAPVAGTPSGDPPPPGEAPEPPPGLAALVERAVQLAVAPLRAEVAHIRAALCLDVAPKTVGAREYRRLFTIKEVRAALKPFRAWGTDEGFQASCRKGRERAVLGPLLKKEGRTLENVERVVELYRASALRLSTGRFGDVTNAAGSRGVDMAAS